MKFNMHTVEPKTSRGLQGIANNNFKISDARQNSISSISGIILRCHNCGANEH